MSEFCINPLTLEELAGDQHAVIVDTQITVAVTTADLWPHSCLQYLAYFLGSYFAIGVVFDLFTLGVLGTSAFQYSTNSGAFLKAVQDVAGSGRDAGGLRLAEKAATAVNTAKVAGALNTITQMLKVGVGLLIQAKFGHACVNMQGLARISWQCSCSRDTPCGDPLMVEWAHGSMLSLQGMVVVAVFDLVVFRLCAPVLARSS